MTILHFSDYHSHAIPFYDAGRGGQGGIARAAGYLRAEKKRGALVFSGGDMVNKGSPSWSDKYQCAEWPWLDGIVDAMAFGNHDADYGRAAFDRCRAAVRYPILSANTAGLQGTAIVRARGVTLGVFAVAGADFPSLVKADGFAFSDRIAAARQAVQGLRARGVNAVVMIGHEHLDDDYALARAVPGIDVIFGSHSHLERELTRIGGTSTWFISPGQYLTRISRVALTFDAGRLTGVEGRLVRVDGTLPLDRTIARRVAAMQRSLERDRQYAELFVPFARLPHAVAVDELARRTLEVMRDAAKTDVALSTRSSFRQPLPPGDLTLEALRASLPYDNEIVVIEMTPEQLQRLLAASAAEEPLVTSALTVDRRPLAESNGGQRIQVAVTDYLANVAGRYRDFFSGAPKRATGLHVRDAVRISFAP